MSKKEIKINQKVTNITRGIIYLMAFAVIVVCGILIPELAREERVSNPNAGPAWPFFIIAWVMSLPIFAALRETLRILNYIDQNTAFSKLTVRAIQNIKINAIVFGSMIVIFAASLIIIGRNIDPTEDFAPVAAFGIVFTFISSVVATFAATLQKLLQDALKIKEENDLTV